MDIQTALKIIMHTLTINWLLISMHIGSILALYCHYKALFNVLLWRLWFIKDEGYIIKNNSCHSLQLSSLLSINSN